MARFRRMGAALLSAALVCGFIAPCLCDPKPSPAATGHCAPVDGLTAAATCCCGAKAPESRPTAITTAAQTDMVAPPLVAEAMSPAADYIQDTSPRFVSFSSSTPHRFTVLRI